MIKKSKDHLFNLDASFFSPSWYFRVDVEAQRAAQFLSVVWHILVSTVEARNTEHYSVFGCHL